MALTPSFDEELLNWTAAHAVAAADRTLLLMAQLGLRVVGGNRLARARGLIDRVGADLDAGGDVRPTKRQLEEAHRTILEHYLIVRALAPSVGALRGRLGELLSGAELPDRDTSTAGRDIQFELLVAALLVFGGVQGVHVGEPDFRIRAGTRDMGIAVKRVSRRKQLTKRVREAIKQIQLSKLPSVLFVLVDWPDESEYPDKRGQEVRSCLDDHLPTLTSSANSGLVLGALMISTSWVWGDPDHTRLGGMTFHAHAHFNAGPAFLDVDQMLRQIGRNTRLAATQAIRELDDEATRLTANEALPLQRARTRWPS
jgi:hypothetical protein